MIDPMRGSYWILVAVVAVAIGLYAIIRLSFP